MAQDAGREIGPGWEAGRIPGSGQDEGRREFARPRERFVKREGFEESGATNGGDFALRKAPEEWPHRMIRREAGKGG